MNNDSVVYTETISKAPIEYIYAFTYIYEVEEHDWSFGVRFAPRECIVLVTNLRQGPYDKKNFTNIKALEALWVDSVVLTVRKYREWYDPTTQKLRPEYLTARLEHDLQEAKNKEEEASKETKRILKLKQKYLGEE